MNILIGSRALNYWNPECKISEDTDWDIITSKNITWAECHDMWLLNNDGIQMYTSDDKIIFNGEIIYIASMKGLSLIKRSHLHRDLSFEKHITHYWKYLEHQKQLYTKDDLEFLVTRKKMTIERFPQAQPNLNQSIDTFFDDAVFKKYKHDYLHELFAYEDVPMYTKLQRDTSIAWCCQDLWYNLSYEQQLKCVAEEVYVIATERFMVPKEWEAQSKLAYMKAIQKVCTTLCSGWFRDFAIDNYPSIIALYDKDRFIAVKQILINQGK